MERCASKTDEARIMTHETTRPYVRGLDKNIEKMNWPASNRICCFFPINLLKIYFLINSLNQINFMPKDPRINSLLNRFSH